MPAVRIGDLVNDNYGRRGVVVRPEPRPSEAWLGAQEDKRLLELPASASWVGIVPLAGGLVISPESLTESLGPPGEDDLREAVSNANPHGVRLLVEALPAQVEAILHDNDGMD